MTILKRTIIWKVLISLGIIINSVHAVDKVVVNHTNWDPSAIDVAILDLVRTKKIIFIHVSVGSNIAGGLRDLRDKNPSRYDLTINHAPVDPNKLDYPAFGHEHFTKLPGYTIGSDDKTTPKINAFNTLMHSQDGNGVEWGKAVDIAYFKFCWVDIRRYDYINPDSIFNNYVSCIQKLINDFPSCMFVYFTCPIKGDINNDNDKLDNIKRHQYNELVRAYIDTAGGYLFDIADIEAYDDNNIYQFFDFQGHTYPKMWYVPENSENDGWSNDGGHFNTKGKERMALATWNLWALIVQQIVPVELVSFKGHPTNEGIRLTWETASEYNNYGFEIERSVNVKEFHRIAFINGQGTTETQNHYCFLDRQAFYGQYYYRLKQIDYGGSYEYSQSIKVSICLPPEEFRLYQNYPNPFNSSTRISYILPINSPVEITIYNVNGEEIYRMKDDFQKAGFHIITWDAINELGSPISTGLYYYNIKTLYHSKSSSMIYLK